MERGFLCLAIPARNPQRRPGWTCRGRPPRADEGNDDGSGPIFQLYGDSGVFLARGVLRSFPEVPVGVRRAASALASGGVSEVNEIAAVRRGDVFAFDLHAVARREVYPRPAASQVV